MFHTWLREVLHFVFQESDIHSRGKKLASEHLVMYCIVLFCVNMNKFPDELSELAALYTFFTLDLFIYPALPGMTFLMSCG